jgi:anti-sigma factor RsiW
MMAQHLSGQQIESWRRKTVPPAELLAIDDHLAACEACRSLLLAPEPQAAFAGLRAEMRAAAREESEHLASELLAAYLDGELDEVDREIAESHLALCEPCTEELQELRAFKALMSTYPAAEYRPAPKPGLAGRLRGLRLFPAVLLPLGTAGAAAAAALAVFYVGVQPLRDQVASERVRADRLVASNAQLQQDATAAADLRTRLTRLEGDAERARREAERLRKENERLKSAPPQPAPPPASQGGTQLALNDGGGGLLRDPQGRLVRTQPLPASVQAAVEQQKLDTPVLMASLIGDRDIVRGGGDQGFAVTGPAGTVVLSDRPAFSWRAMPRATGYVVSVYDAELNRVAASGPITGTSWRPEQPLARGGVYQWEVTALRGQDEIGKAPSPPAPEAKFKVLEADRAAALREAQRVHAGSRLTLGILYAEAGLLDEAERELRGLRQANPDSELARKLLTQLLRLRDGRPSE